MSKWNYFKFFILERTVCMKLFFACLTLKFLERCTCTIGIFFSHETFYILSLPLSYILCVFISICPYHLVFKNFFSFLLMSSQYHDTRISFSTFSNQNLKAFRQRQSNWTTFLLHNLKTETCKAAQSCTAHRKIIFMARTWRSTFRWEDDVIYFYFFKKVTTFESRDTTTFLDIFHEPAL